MERNDSPLGFTVEGILTMAGGRMAVAEKTGVVFQSVAKWSRRIPKQHARTVAVMAGLPLEIVRPDMVQRGHREAHAYIADKRGRLNEKTQ